MTRDAPASAGDVGHVTSTSPTHLVILCCHAVYHGATGSDPRDEGNWALKPFQKGTATKSGEHTTFLQHAFAAINLASPTTLVAFSGGPTDASYPHLSEAQSYVNAFKDWSRVLGLKLPEVVEKNQVILEEHATDSYQNVLFSILEFRRRIGYYPTDLTIVTHAFKNERFLQLHAKALKWPKEKVKVLGLNPPFTVKELESTIAGEQRNGYAPWTTDLYGVGEVLGGKRRVRGWKGEKSDELGGDLEEVVRELLRWEGGETGKKVFGGRLPWEEG